MKVTVESVISSSEFMKIALPDAIAVVAKANSQTIETTKHAFFLGVEAVQKSVAKLIIAAANAVADKMNSEL